jgi:hypothetical protein
MKTVAIRARGVVKFLVLRWPLRAVSIARSASRQRRIAAEQAHARDRPQRGSHQRYAGRRVMRGVMPPERGSMMAQQAHAASLRRA